MLVELIHSLPFLSILVADRLPRLALDGHDRGKHFNPFGRVLAWRAHAAHRVGSRDNTFLEVVSTPTSRSTSRSRPIASDAHACHRDQPEQGMVGRLAHPVSWHSQRCRQQRIDLRYRHRACRASTGQHADRKIEVEEYLGGSRLYRRLSNATRRAERTSLRRDERHSTRRAIRAARL